MTNKKITTRLLALLLVIIIVLPTIVVTVFATEEEEALPLEGKTVSILGDSISTFTNISSGTAADKSNSTIRENRVFYGSGTNGVQVNDTWWMQVIHKLGGRLLVNNSYSRSTIFNPNDDKASQGYYERCVNLHDNTGYNAGEEPDIIIVYMGINDFAYCRDTLGIYEDIDFDSLINDGKYSEPTTTCEAYAIMLHKITNRYPDAEIYCFNLPAKKTFEKNEEAVFKRYNNSIKKIAEYYDCYVVDAYNDTGIIRDKKSNEMYLADGVHPNKNGMTAIANSFLNCFYSNSRYINDNTELCNIDYILSDVIIDNGKVTRVKNGMPFTCTMSAIHGNPLDIIVLSKGNDISDEVVFDDNIIYIPEVNNDIKIIASAISTYDTSSYFYEKESNENGEFLFNNITSDGYNENKLTPIHCSNETGFFYKTDNTISLRYTEPWSIVWETTYANNPQPLSLYNYSEHTRENNTYIKYDPSTTLLSISIYKHGNFCDYGVKLNEYGVDTSVSHSYRLTNVLNGTTENTVYLYIDGRRIAPIFECYVNGEKNDEDYNRWNGKDLFINYVGCYDAGVDLSFVDSLEIYENYNNSNHTHELIYTHSYDLSCTEDERTEMVCKCGFTETDISTKATGHTMINEIIKSATETEEGIAIRKCSVCGIEAETITIPIVNVTVPTYVKVLVYISILIIPLMLLTIGIITVIKKEFTKPNRFIGYRTPLSRKNQDTWNVANKLMGKINLVVGAIMLPLSVLVMIPFINKTESILNTAVTVITLVQVVILILSIIPVEVKLNKTFDKDGNRKDKQK